MKSRERFWPYSSEVGGTEDAADVAEVSEQQAEDLRGPLLVMRTDLVQGEQLLLNRLQSHLEHRNTGGGGGASCSGPVRSSAAAKTSRNYNELRTSCQM